MLDSIKSEFKKLFTIRSTYVILALVLALVVFFAFWIEGFRNTPPGKLVVSDGLLASEVTSAITSVGTFFALIAVLLVSHEYRYNTIMYTLTSSKSRTRTFLSKVIVMSLFAVVASLIVAVLSPALTALGLKLNGVSMVHQTIPAILFLKAAFIGWGFVMLALILAFIIRHQIGALVAIFMIPTTVEGLMTLLLKEDAIYLPYGITMAVINHSDKVTSGTAALIATSYYIVGGAVAWWLFRTRDAN